MSSITLTTAYNTTKVICNNTTIKQIWVKEGTKDKVQVYQAWKTEAYTAYTNHSEKCMNATAQLTAYSAKHFVSARVNSSYVAYSFNFLVKINSVASSNSAAYAKFYYYNPDGTLTASKTVYATDSAGTKLNNTYAYKSVYGNYSDYDSKQYKGTLKWILSTALNGKTVDSSTSSSTATCPVVLYDKTYSASAVTGYQGGDCYRGYQTSYTAYRNVEDNG